MNTALTSNNGVMSYMTITEAYAEAQKIVDENPMGVVVAILAGYILREDNREKEGTDYV